MDLLRDEPDEEAAGVRVNDDIDSLIASEGA